MCALIWSIFAHRRPATTSASPDSVQAVLAGHGLAPCSAPRPRYGAKPHKWMRSALQSSSTALLTPVLMLMLLRVWIPAYCFCSGSSRWVLAMALAMSTAGLSSSIVGVVLHDVQEDDGGTGTCANRWRGLAGPPGRRGPSGLCWGASGRSFFDFLRQRRDRVYMCRLQQPSSLHR